jgi:hypothetical protein
MPNRANSQEFAVRYVENLGHSEHQRKADRRQSIQAAHQEPEDQILRKL